MGLWVSGSHDPGEIACEIACNLNDAICSHAICSHAICSHAICSHAICSHAICKHAICALVAAGDEATSESYKGMNLAPMDGSLVVLFSFAAIALFPTLLRLFLAR